MPSLGKDRYRWKATERGDRNSRPPTSALVSRGRRSRSTCANQQGPYETRPGHEASPGAPTATGAGLVRAAEAVDTFVLTSPSVQIGMFCPVWAHKCLQF